MSDYRPFVGRRILVQLPDVTIDGTLVRDGKSVLTLEAASAVTADGGSKPIDGTIIVSTAHIPWVQVV